MTGDKTLAPDSSPHSARSRPPAHDKVLALGASPLAAPSAAATCGPAAACSNTAASTQTKACLPVRAAAARPA